MDITIIGGGFSGAACALHFLRDHPGIAARLTIVEPRPVLGAGLAYSSPAPEHRTNVAAARMSVWPEQPLHLHEWLHEIGDPARDPASAMPDGRLYPSRAVFGRYVQAQLQAQVAANPAVAFTHVRQAATAVSPAGGRFRIHLANGAALNADAVVLAISHTKPDLPAVLRSCAAVLRDPWDVAALERIAPEARVLVVGTGLTACDVIATLLARGHAGPITALSRHGLLPRPRTLLPVEAEGDFATQPETTALGLLRRVRRAMDTAMQAGRPWENIIDALRQQAAAAWGTLDWAQRRILLRHLRTFWDVHRFQCAPQIDAALTRAQETGALAVRAAHLLSATDVPGGVQVRLRPRGNAGAETLDCDVVINCTGPGHRSVTAAHPVLRGLAEAGLLMADPASLGIWVDAQSRVLRAGGTAWDRLFVAGPLARGTHGELMGLPQVNLQPRAVAAQLAALVRDGTRAEAQAEASV
jgi:uncharacterized NAD(P)/FAD-binding protein YdhS